MTIPMDWFATVKYQGRYGVINARGQFVLPATHDFLGDVGEGLVCFRRENVFGFLDLEGRVVIDPQFESDRCAGPIFKNGVALVGRSGALTYVDREGTPLFPQFFEAASDFGPDRSIVKIASGHLHKIIARNGALIGELEIAEIPSVPDWPENWDCFCCFVVKEGKWLVASFDLMGTCIFSPTYPWMSEFENDVAAFCETETPDKSPCGIVTLSGEVRVAPAFFGMSGFSGGLARSKNNLGKFGYIDADGHWVIPPVFKGAAPFREGLACVKLDRTWGFIDQRGTMVIDPRFASEGEFKNGVAQMGMGDSLEFIDKEGNVIWSASRV